MLTARSQPPERAAQQPHSYQDLQCVLFDILLQVEIMGPQDSVSSRFIIL